MLKVNDIPEQVIRDIAGAYHRRLESTGTEAQDEKERDFQRACYLRTALEWLAIWINQQAAPAAQVAQGVADDVVRDASDDWIPHDGTACPLQAGVLIEIRWRNGREFFAERCRHDGEAWRWHPNSQEPDNIVAYRLSDSQK